MRESGFELHKYSGRAYTADEIISFSQSPLTHFADVDREMAFHTGARHVMVSSLTQSEFDAFVSRYGDRFQSIYFFQNPKVRDLSALAGLHHVEYLLFYNLRAATGLWDMRGNAGLKGLMFSDSKRLIYDLTPLSSAPALEELLLFSRMDHKYPVRSLEPVRRCPNLRRVWLECNTDARNFDPAGFAGYELFYYRVDGKRYDPR